MKIAILTQSSSLGYTQIDLENTPDFEKIPPKIHNTIYNEENQVVKIKVTKSKGCLQIFCWERKHHQMIAKERIIHNNNKRIIKKYNEKV